MNHSYDHIVTTAEELKKKFLLSDFEALTIAARVEKCRLLQIAMNAYEGTSQIPFLEGIAIALGAKPANENSISIAQAIAEVAEAILKTNDE